MPWTAHIVVHFGHAEEFREADWSAFQTKLLDKAVRWLDRRGVPAVYGWVTENGPIKGPHLHWMLHLPRHLWGRFKTYLLHAGRFTVSDQSGEAIRITGGAFGMYTKAMRAGVTLYASKSLDCSDRTLDALGIRPRPSLPVFAQRCGVSHSCGITARRLAGWQERRTLHELHAHLNPARAAAVEVCHVAA